VKINVNVLVQGSPPKAASPVRVQLRDTSLVDAPSIVIAELRTTIKDNLASPLASVQFDIASVPRGTTVWAHVDMDDDGKVSAGDYITTRSFPVPPGTGTVNVDVHLQRV
jgi:uncharacterized lipoprotein YbaY